MAPKVFINGYGWTGSSAVFEAVCNHSSTSFVPNEFDDLRVPFGMMDEAIRKIEIFNGNDPISFSRLAIDDTNRSAPIKRFKGWKSCALNFLRAFYIPLPIRGLHERGIRYRIYFFKFFWQQIFEVLLTNKAKKLIRNSSNKRDVISILNKWLNSVSKCYGGKERLPTLFDQGLLLEHISEWLDYIDNGKVILVIREPKNQFADIAWMNTNKTVEMLMVRAFKR